MLDLTRPPPDRPASATRRIELHSRITVDPKTGYSPELKARVEAEIARARTFEPLAAAASQPARKLRRKDVSPMRCYTTQPPARDYVLPGLPRGKVGSIVSPGGLGKSMIALLMSHCIAGGLDLLGLGNLTKGKVAYLSGEDGEDIMHERLHSIGARLNVVDREECDKNFSPIDLTESDPDLMDVLNPEGGFVQELEQIAGENRLLFLDTLRSFHRAKENDDEKMAELVGHFRAIAARTKCAIVFLHHSNKALAVSGQGDLQQAARGSSVLTDNVRWQGYLVGMTTEESKKLSLSAGGQPIGEDGRTYYVRFGLSKINYGAPLDEIWYRRGMGGVLEPVKLCATVSPESVT